MNNYLVVADDFTGANDTGVQICRRSIPIKVVFDGGGISNNVDFSYVIDTESRFLPAEAAFQKVSSVMNKIPCDKFSNVIKKVDSTLRGNIAFESRAMSLCCKPELVIFAPAFPDLGRTTEKGVHYLHGVPVSKTELARDPKTPVTIDNIFTIMKEAFPDESISHVKLDDLRKANFDFNNGRVFCFDAVTNEDLALIVTAVNNSKKSVLWVGCAGLVDIILSVALPLKPALAVIASLSSVTRSQVLYAEKQGMLLQKIPFYSILEKSITEEEITREAVQKLKSGRDLILLSSSSYSIEEYEKTENSARKAGISKEEMSLFTQDFIGKLTLQVIDELYKNSFGISGLFLSGGDTAISFFEKAGAYGSSIKTEIATGIPLMQLEGGKYNGLKVVTKAGAFGNEDAVFYALRKLKEK